MSAVVADIHRFLYTLAAMLPLRILLLADDPLARAGLASVLDDRTGVQVVGQEPVAIDLLAALDLYHPDILLWDLGWDPDPDAVRTTSQAMANLGAAFPPVAALLPDVGDATAFAADLRATGTRGLLFRNARPQTLMAALSAVAAGLAVLDPALQADLSPIAPPPAPLPESLTPREREVLRLLAEGSPNKAIAHQLGISEHTVKFHVNAIMGKLGAQSRTEAAVRAARSGLVLL